MNSIRTLHDAFETLAHRADVALESADEYTVRTRTAHRPAMRYLAPAAAAAVVLVGGGAVALWQNSSNDSSQAPAAASSPVPSPSASPPPPASPSAPPTTYHGHYLPPQTSEELAAKARTILAGTATISVKHYPKVTGPPKQVIVPGGSEKTVEVPVPDPSADTSPDDGAGIDGTLTADGRSGGYLLDVYAMSPPLKAGCSGDVGNTCTVVQRPDGSSLAVGHWDDRSVPGGVSYEVQYVRPDHATILLVLSTEADPKGESTVSTDRLPLTQTQMIAFVTDSRW